jgi:hypothetical protein
MTTKDIITIATAALGTATLTVAGFWAGPIDAGNDTEAPPAKIAKARLLAHGVDLALVPAGGRTFRAGDQAEFELTALNTTDQPASVEVGVSMTASAPADLLSRTVRLPSVLWQQQQVVSLQPRETKVLALATSTNLPPNSMVNVSLREPGTQAGPAPSGITALTFSTVVPKPAPVVALAQ